MSNYHKVVIYLSAKIFWILLMVVCWFAFMDIYLSSAEDARFAMWMSWGFACLLFMIPTAFRFFKSSAKGGYEEGKHHYEASFFGNGMGGVGMHMHDKRYSTAIVSLVIGIVLFLFVGPVLLVLKVINSIVKLVMEFIKYRAMFSGTGNP